MVHEFKPDLMIEEKIPIARANRLPDSIRSFDPFKKWWAVPTLQMYKVELRVCLINRRQSHPWKLEEGHIRFVASASIRLFRFYLRFGDRKSHASASNGWWDFYGSSIARDLL